MRYRRMIRDNDKNQLVWFGSYGTNTDGTAKFAGDGKHDNFSTEQLGVKDSLTQHLSTIKGELWYSINFGIPLVDKFSSKSEVDTEIMNMILSHPEVDSIISFESSVNGREYSCEVKIQSTFGVVTLTV